MEIFTITVLRLYQGESFILLLYAGALAFLFLKEKDPLMRLLFIYAPLLLMAVFLVPKAAALYVRLFEGETYYRLLWLLPQEATVAYAGVRLFKKQPLFSVLLGAAMILLAGRIPYSGPYVEKAENPYHLPQSVVEVCDAILPENGDLVCAVFPDEMLHFVRQYSSRIIMPYGRETIVESWGADNPFHRLMLEGSIETGELSVTAKGFNCNYIITHEDQEFQEPLENYGYVLQDKIKGYAIWRDTTIKWPN